LAAFERSSPATSVGWIVLLSKPHSSHGFSSTQVQFLVSGVIVMRPKICAPSIGFSDADERLESTLQDVELLGRSSRLGGDMPNAVTRHISNELYMAAGLLVIFGFAKMGGAGPSQPIQVILAVLCAGAAAFVRQGGSTARVTGILAAGSTVAFGTYCLWTGHGFVPGSIISVYALVRLFGCAAAFDPAMTVYAAALQPNQWQPTPAVHHVPAASSTGYAPQWVQPQAAWQPASAATPQWSAADLQHYFAPPTGEVPPPPPPSR
jgi:hypothetical protein